MISKICANEMHYNETVFSVPETKACEDHEFIADKELEDFFGKSYVCKKCFCKLIIFK